MEIVAMKMKLDHGCKIEKKKRLFLLSYISIYWSYISFDTSIKHNLGTGFFIFKVLKLMEI